ncbi:MAG: flagellar hook assembly protein FlgD [Alphaproteobacteria bacterium]|nr:flagellar hook assembly protein FlgD [Alphaproteobacteria bacterium]MBN9496710.1 flagellar hook assembly protein FlgD [Alphaproteobacteria bacterium]
MSGSITTNYASGGAATGASAASAATFGKNFDTFLKLLTAQLQNQNPLSPMDTTQFTQQLVQFSSVEQSIRQNQNLETLIALQKSSQAGNAVSYIGKEVDLNGSVVGLVDSVGVVTYELPEEASRTIINIYDKDGALVRRMEGTNKAGRNAVEWNGTSDTGAQVPDGDYKVEVVAQNAAAQNITVKTVITGVVSDVRFINGTTMLTVDGVTLPLSQLGAVRGTAPTPS